MKKILRILPFLFPVLTGCGPQETVIEEDSLYVYYMWNCPRMDYEAPSSNPIRIDSLLYQKAEIEADKPFLEPTAPVRESYDFAGWCTEPECENAWNFATDTSNISLYLYARWVVSAGEDYVEPEYIHPETIVEENVYRVTGILNIPVNGSSVALTAGAIARLEAHKEDVSFALNYERGANVTLTSATYDAEAKRITVLSSDEVTETIDVSDKTATLSIANENQTFETKARTYEANGADYENYHILLAGSSSMEYWEKSSVDMMPMISYNHGIAGSTVQQWTNKLTERLIAPYSPKAVVYYIGVNNIINSYNTGAETGELLVELFDKTHAFLPHAEIFYVLINRLPYYLNRQNDFDVANNAAKEYAAEHDYLRCIDAGKGLLKPNGNPNWAYFRSDGLHMSDYGYIIWGGAIKQAIMDYLG